MTEDQAKITQTTKSIYRHIPVFIAGYMVGCLVTAVSAVLRGLCHG